MKSLYFLFSFFLIVIVSNAQTYPINQNLGRTVSTLVSTNSIRADQGFILGHFQDTTAANAINYLKNYPYALITVDTNVVLMRDRTATRWMYIPVEGQIINGDTIHYLINVSRRPGSDSVYGKYYNGFTSYETFQFIDSTGEGASTDAWKLTGNTGTNPATNFVGTVDNVALNFRVNNVSSGKITSAGVTLFGYQAGENNIGQFVTGIGIQALQDNEGNYATGVGWKALMKNTGTLNTAIGISAMENNTSGGNNTAAGANALVTNTTGSRNSGFGGSALNNNTTGSSNTAVGYDAIGASETGDSTVAIGYETGFNLLSGDANTLVGAATGLGITTGSYNTIIGANVTGLTSSLSNNIILADGQGNKRLRFNSSGALSFDGGSNYGTSGQVLTSNGSGAAPTWEPVATGTPTLQQVTDAGNNTTNDIVVTTTSSHTVAMRDDAGSAILEIINPGRTHFFVAGSDAFVFGQSSPSVKLQTITRRSTLANNSTIVFPDSSGTVALLENIPTTTPISSLTAATGANEIDNGAFTQEWQWPNLISDPGLFLSSNSTTANGGQKLFQVDLFGANANSAQTTYGGYFTNRHTGTTSVNVAGLFSSTDGATNYAIIVPASSGSVGIGTSTPTQLLEVAGNIKYTGQIASTKQTVTYGTTTTWDWNAGTNAEVTLTGNITTFTITNAVAGTYATIRMIQDGTGARLLSALPSGSKVFNGGAGAITLSTAANAIDLLTVYYDGTNYYWNYALNYN